MAARLDPRAATRVKMRAMRSARARNRHIARLGVTIAGAVLAWYQPTFALNPALDVSQYGHTAWKIGEGFSQGLIAGIAQTPDGYLWLGTEFGLLRFDGVRTVPWQPPAGQHLPDNNIRGLFASRDGTLWIGTLKGLASWKDGKLTEYQELAGTYVDALIEDREGTVWAGATTVPNGRLCAIQNGGVHCYGTDGTFGAAVESVYEDSRGNLWVGATTGLWRWKPGPPQHYPASGPMAIPQAIVEDDQGALVISSQGGLKWLVDGRVEEYPIRGTGRRLSMTCLFRDRDGGLWMGSLDGLVHVHQGKTDVFVQSDGLSGVAVYHLLEDREGSLWAVTSAGLDRFRDVSVVTLSVKQGLSSDVMGAVLAARDGSMWIATGGGLNRWHNEQITIPRTDTATRDGKLDGVPPEALLEDARGRIWVSTRQGLGYLENGHSVSVRGVPPGVVRSIVEDAAGHLWIAHQNHGLLRVSAAHDVHEIPWSTLGHKDFAVTLAADDTHDGLWLGFYEGGVAYVTDGQVRGSYTAVDGLGEGFVGHLRLTGG